MDNLEQALPAFALLMVAGVFVVKLTQTASKTIDKIFPRLQVVSEQCTKKGDRIKGAMKGFEYEVRSIRGRHSHWGFSVSMKGTFPKQKRFMFDYPVLENKIKWRGNRLVKQLPDKRADEIETTLKRMVVLANGLEDKRDNQDRDKSAAG